MSERPRRYLTTAKGSNIPQRVLYVWCETTTRCPACGVAPVYLHEWFAHEWPPMNFHSGLCASQFWSLVYRYRQSTIIVTDNACRDAAILGLWTRLDSGELRLTDRDPVLCDPPTIVNVTHGRQQITWIDTRNYGTDDWHAVDAGLRDWIQSGHSRWGMTAASLAWQSFGATGGLSKIQQHGDTLALKLERAAMYGGICEANHVGVIKGPVAQVDIRSFYPSVMRNLAVPVELLEIGQGRAELCAPEMIAEVQIDTNESGSFAGGRYPYRRGGKVIYPHGKYWTVLCGPELTQAIERNEVYEFGRWAMYRLEPIFSTWVDAVLFRRRRAEECGNANAVSLWKSVANSLWGKFAAKSHQWQRAVPDHTPHRWGEWVHVDNELLQIQHWRAIAGHTWLELEQGEHPDSVPMIAAWITSAARVKARQAMEMIRFCSSEIYYWDTDGGLVSKCPLINMLEPNKYVNINGFRCVGTHSEAEILGLKSYRLDDTWHVAGLSRNAKVTDGGVAIERVGARGLAHMKGELSEVSQTWERAILLGSCDVPGTVNADGSVTPPVVHDDVRVEL